MLVDSHCHLDFPDFAGDLEAVIARARAAGVVAIQTVATTLEGFVRVREIAEAHEGLWCSVGVHPHEAAKVPALDAARLIALARHPKVIGIGETGLDYHYQHSPREAQKAAFRAHLRAAGRAGLPVIIHARDADEDVEALMREAAAEKPFTGVLHCFTAGPGLAAAALELGLYVSFSGIVTFRNAESVREAARAVPPERLLVETDAPYLAPVPHRGRRNEPAYVVETARRLAEVKGMPFTALARRTSANFYALFARAGKPPDPGAGPA